MALLIAKSKAKSEVLSERAAARAVADQGEGASPEAIIDRLRRGYAENRQTLEAWAQDQLRPPPPPKRRRQLSVAELDQSSAAAKSYPSDIARSLDPFRETGAVAGALELLEDSAEAAMQRHQEQGAAAELRRYVERRDKMLNPLKGTALGAALEHLRESLKGKL